MKKPHDYPFQKRLYELRGLPPVYGEASGLQDISLESGYPAQVIGAEGKSVSTEADNSLAVSWYIPAPQRVLEIIHQIANAPSDNLGRLA